MKKTHYTPAVSNPFDASAPRQIQADGRFVPVLTEPFKDEIVRAHQSGLSAPEIHQALKVSIWSIRKVLEERGLRCHTIAQLKEKLSAEEQLEACEMYAAGATLKTVATHYCVSPTVIKRALLLHGHSCRDSSACMRRHSLNEAAFDAPLSEAARYWIGFLMADGSVRVRSSVSSVVNLGLALKDRGHLEKYRAFLGSSHAITEGRGKGNRRSCLLAVASKRLAGALAGYGVTPRKTFTAKAIGLECDRDFWRGVVDGDGSVFWAGRNSARIRPCISLVGARPLMEQFAGYVESIIGRRPTLSRRPSIWNVRVNDLPAVRLIGTLYGGAVTVLDRKNATAQQIIGAGISSSRRQPWEC